MIAGDRKSIELVDDVIWIRAEYDATERVAYFDARPPEGRTVHGHSLARWQDGVLIVDTSNFTENPIGITNGLPSSNEKHLVERFALDADGQSLIYSFELTDPIYLAEPLIGQMRWLYRPMSTLSWFRAIPMRRSLFSITDRPDWSARPLKQS